MASQYLAQLGHGTSTDKLLLSGAGSLGLLAATTAFSTQRTSGLQPGRLLIYGVLFELGRRAWDWSYARFTWGALGSVHNHIATVMTDVSSRNEGYCNVHAGRSRVRVGHASSGEFALPNLACDQSALYLQTQEGLWKRTKDFDVSVKSTQRKWAVSMFNGVGAKQSADYVPKWLRPVLFRWNGYWVDVSRIDSGASNEHIPGFSPAGLGSMRLQ
jgi:hypothetical protein